MPIPSEECFEFGTGVVQRPSRLAARGRGAVQDEVLSTQGIGGGRGPASVVLPDGQFVQARGVHRVPVPRGVGEGRVAVPGPAGLRGGPAGRERGAGAGDGSSRSICISCCIRQSWLKVTQDFMELLLGARIPLFGHWHEELRRGNWRGEEIPSFKFPSP